LLVDNLVSVIIVAFNNWPDLELAIQSALHQSYKNIEVIVVDNWSTDETAQLVPKLFADRVTYIRQANTGDGGGRNTGVRVSQGEFVQFLDGDDFLAPDKVEKQIAMLRALPEVDAVYGDVRQFQTSAGAATWVDCDTQGCPDMLATLLSPHGNGAGLVVHSLIFRRRALDLTGAWIENLPVSDGPVLASMSDQDYWLRAAWSGVRFRYCQGSLCFQRRRSGQLSSNRHAVLAGLEQVFTSAWTYITREPYRTAVSRRLSHLLFYLAVSDKQSSREASLARLRKARTVDIQFLTKRIYAVGWLLIVTGVGPFIFGRWLKPVRSLGALLAGAKRPA
jgi:glycosyltransferase involved in cell wall biosynthesis